MNKKNIAILSNITTDLIKQKLQKHYDIYIPEGFDTWIQEVINPSSNLYQTSFHAVILLLDGTEARSWLSMEEGKNKITLWKQAVDSLTDKMDEIPIFISTIDFRLNRIKALAERTYHQEFSNAWYQYIQNLAETKKNIYVFDLADTIFEIGRKQFYSDKMWYMSSMPYSREGLTIICQEIKRLLNSAFTSRKKIIVLDLDNTLWGGIIGEDGIDGIELSKHKEGQRFYDFQRQLMEMQKRGTLLAINSKNNIEDAKKAIEGHPFMLLHKDNFVSEKINWLDKASNLKAIASELNLTEGSFVFIDDNPVEREVVKGECMDVTVPEFPQDTTTLIDFGEQVYFDYFKPLRVLTSDLKKTEMYHNESKRIQEYNTSLNLDDYIKKMEICVDIHRMRSDELERVAQLCSKTNQFNVTTKRYTKAEIKQISDNPNNIIFVTYVSDKYGESGLVSVLIIFEQENKAKIDTFLMSCRVMGRNLEKVIIDEIADYYKARVDALEALYIPTAKNKPVENLFENLNFELISSKEGIKQYTKTVNNFKKTRNTNYSEIKFKYE